MSGSRAWRRIGCAGIPQINHGARIHHTITGAAFPFLLLAWSL
jgi:hypothetical protein